MKFPLPPRLVLILAAVLLATNLITGLVTAHAVRARDFSNQNMTYMLTWGTISQRFEEARDRRIPGVRPMSETEIYHGYEDTARFNVHYPKFCRRLGLDKSSPQVLLGWAVAADQFHSDNVNIQVDSAVWRAFLSEGPKELPLYWGIRDDLTRTGAGEGLIRAEDPMHGLTRDKATVYQVPRLSTPYQPLPGEATPS